MQDPTTLDLAEFNHTFQRCAAAYHRVMADMPERPGYLTEQKHWQKASLAFIAELPPLLDPSACHLYIACIAQGVGIGAVDGADSGRLCHLAQMAISVWKLVNLTIPAARQKEKEAAEKKEKSRSTDHESRSASGTPLPSNGNQPSNRFGDLSNIQVEMALQDALSRLPRFDVQKKHFHLLRSRGWILPCDAELRENTLAALHFCREAERVIHKETLAEYEARQKKAFEPTPDSPAVAPESPAPAPESQAQPQQAA
jgi:hypothetical protein